LLSLSAVGHWPPIVVLLLGAAACSTAEAAAAISRGWLQQDQMNKFSSLLIDACVEQLAMSISAIVQLSKGWQGHPPPGVQNALSASTDISLKVLLALSASPIIRNERQYCFSE
jgi:hypothetical protein